jgi:hypothetical protein
MRRLGGLLLALAVLGLAACANGSRAGSASGSAAASVSTTPEGSAGAASSASASVPVPAAGSGRPSANPTATLVQFGRQGGLMGVNDQLTVREDGGFTIVRSRPAVNRSGTLRAADLAELRKVLEQADFANQPKVQPARGNDLYTYMVIYDGNQVLAVDGGIDERLKPVIGTLSGLVGRYSG